MMTAAKRTPARQINLDRRHLPVGTLTAAISPQGLCRLAFPDETLKSTIAALERAFPGASLAVEPGCADQVFSELEEYFTGRRREFGLKLDLAGTPFQLGVWQALGRIPFGQTVAYGELARDIGRPGAARAVGSAVGQNPVAIVVPWHRVLAAGGGIGGFGGGLPMKRQLLAVEGIRV